MTRTWLLGLAALSALSCGDGFGVLRAGPRLEVRLIEGENPASVGTRERPLKLTIDQPQPFRIVVRAVDRHGDIDTGFNGFVRISAKPGAIEKIDDRNADGRNLKLTNGESAETSVRLTNAFGTTFILADDLGYTPLDPLGDQRPACADGIDNDGDGRIDFPADDGCAFANDDSEGGGSYAQGASLPIFYELPRVADLRGLKCIDPNDVSTCSGTGKTPYPKEQLQVATGYSELTNDFSFDLVVTRIASDGFYVSDTRDPRGKFNNIFAFNFNSPARMRVCDRIKTFAGTATEFFGLTQISNPTWTLEEWDPSRRPCLVPEPKILDPLTVCPKTGGGGCGQNDLVPITGSLVRVISTGKNLSVKVTPKFGPDLVPERGGRFMPDENATNCDIDKDGQISFDRLPDGSDNPEGRCATACANDHECTEYSNFVTRSTFRLTLADGEGNTAAIQADATTWADFKPLERKGQPIRSFTGTLHFFSGGAQFTIEARCKDDIVVDLNQQPLPPDKACVHQRTDLEQSPQ